MFFKKHFFVSFISKHFIDSGYITVGKKILFEGAEAFEYTEETFSETFKKIGEVSKGKVRIVLSEELVYVTELSFPSGTRITRDVVLEKAEQSIPEDLRKTAWDFQTLHYAEKSKEKGEILVQVAVIEKSFSDIFRAALTTNPLAIESIFPESYVFANFEKEEAGVAVIVAQNRESVLICAVEDGFAIVTRVEEGGITIDKVREFLQFLSLSKGKKAERIIFSRFTEEDFSLFLPLADEGYEILARDYNPLIGAALHKKVTGKDEDVLNIDILSSPAKNE